MEPQIMWIPRITGRRGALQHGEQRDSLRVPQGRPSLRLERQRGGGGGGPLRVAGPRSCPTRSGAERGAGEGGDANEGRRVPSLVLVILLLSGGSVMAAPVGVVGS